MVTPQTAASVSGDGGVARVRRAARAEARGSSARGAMLLEVILSMGLLLFGMVMVGRQIRVGLDMARSSDIQTRALVLADTKLSELDAGLVRPEEYEEEIKGDFGILYPGYTWYAEVEETDIEDFYMITLKIGYNEDRVQEQIDDPDCEIDFEDEGTWTVHTVYRLWPRPADVDLQRDFGLSDEEMEAFLAELDTVGDDQLQGALDEAGLGDLAGAAGGSVSELLTDLLQMTATGGFDPRMLAQQLTEEQFMMVAGLLETAFGRGGPEMLQRFGNRLPGGRRPGGRDGRPGGRDGPGGGPGDGPGGPDGGPGGPPGGGGEAGADEGNPPEPGADRPPRGGREGRAGERNENR